ncbi:uncharacterized protein PV09_02153 [Verruconis gallopava]|uniref:Uncharacterized protein n=1 Tax=Verruconis gallopava TaxID=253628 RepID=A0A0D2AKC4_9PEZI|nr:uncharacterized protein PV09_02153 [Verruconis gallopava]KIW07303.1 hypothetical protein PV09_02153 [Verruconis gallopava]
MATNGAQESSVSYEELIQLEYEFNDAEDELVRRQYELERPLYARRAELVAKIPNFWALVLEQAPPDVDQYIQPSDSQVFAECLTGISVERFDIQNTPRSFSITFTFAPNEWFEDATLEKKFYFRRAADNWTGLVSEPVKINWKQGKDLSLGLTDAAIKLWEARTENSNVANGAGKAAHIKQRKEVIDLINKSSDSASRFFTLFGFVSERRYVSAEESDAANKAEKERRAKAKAGEEVEDVEEEEVDFEEIEAEVCPHGADLATMIAEDIWPNAIKYFTQAQEMDDEELSEIDFEEASDDDESGDEIDIRALVKGKSSKRKEKDSDLESPPASKRKQ